MAQTAKPNILFVMADQMARIECLIEAVFVERLGDAGENFAAGHADIGDGDFRAVASDLPKTPPVANAKPDDVVLTIYTSGTTGVLKAAQHTQTSYAGICRNILLNLFPVLPEDSMLHSASLIHASGTFVLPFWLRGGKTVILPGFSPDTFLAAIEKYRVTSINLVPTMIQMLLEHPDIDKRDTSSLQRIIYGASPMPRAVIDRAISRFGQDKFWQYYGQTEVPLCIAVLRPEDHHGDLLSACGRPAADVEGKGGSHPPGPPAALLGLIGIILDIGSDGLAAILDLDNRDRPLGDSKLFSRARNKGRCCRLGRDSDHRCRDSCGCRFHGADFRWRFTIAARPARSARPFGSGIASLGVFSPGAIGVAITLGTPLRRQSGGVARHVRLIAEPRDIAVRCFMSLAILGAILTLAILWTTRAATAATATTAAAAAGFAIAPSIAFIRGFIALGLIVTVFGVVTIVFGVVCVSRAARLSIALRFAFGRCALGCLGKLVGLELPTAATTPATPATALPLAALFGSVGIFVAIGVVRIAIGLNRAIRFVDFLDVVVVFALVEIDFDRLRFRCRRQFFARRQHLDALEAIIRRRQLVIGVEIDAHAAPQFELGEGMTLLVEDIERHG